MQEECNIIVIGSGTMGAGIAAQIANSGNKVYLFDIVPNGSTDRNILAKNALGKLTNVVTSEQKLNNIIPGNLEDNIDIIAKADWIIEVIIEKLEIKQQLYSKLESICKQSCIITSNTSTIPLSDLIKNRSENFKKNFFITHFFNPPRLMQLVELIISSYNEKEKIAKITELLDVSLGKTVINSNDTPGFIANRIGCYFLQVALNLAVEMKLSVEEVDSVLSKPIGFPKTGVFGLYDLIGLDVMELIAKSLSKSLPTSDLFNEVAKMPDIATKMISEGMLGRKSKNGGFYRMLIDETGKKNKESIDLATGEYKQTKEIISPLNGVKDVFDLNDFAKKVLLKTLSYAASIIPATSESIYDIDQAMKLGYSWKFGPFEMLDLIGVDHFCAELTKENLKVPALFENWVSGKKLYENRKYFTAHGDYKIIPKPAGVIYINEFSNVILENQSAKFKDLNDNVAGFEITSKMGVLDHNVFEAILKFYQNFAEQYKTLVIYGGDPNFSVGANLKFMHELAVSGKWQAVDEYLSLGQEAMLKLKYSKIPVVSALRGMALGGGMEVILHSHHTVAHIETNSGLVETGVGLIPSFGGCAQLILKATTKEELKNNFVNIMLGKTSSSADELQNMFNLPNFSVCMNINRVLAEAKNKSLKVQTSNIKKNKLSVNISDLIDNVKLELHDKVIAEHLAYIFSQTDLNEKGLLSLERQAFIDLLNTRQTQERILYMLEKGKRLKN